MEKYKRIHMQPLITREQVYTVEVFVPRRGKKLVHTLTVTGQDKDLKYCEQYDLWADVKERIVQLHFELELDDLCD